MKVGLDVARPREWSIPGYRPELDGVRALAVLAVMMYHFSYIRHGYRFDGGFLGVDVFFVLSGYLITTLLLQEIAATNVLRLGMFYARRALRLLPALVIVIAFAGVVSLTLQHQINSRPFWQSALYSFTYVGNWADAHLRLGLLGHTWSLAIEEQYYLIWPVTLVALLRVFRSRYIVAAFAASAATLIAIVRFVLFTQGHWQAAALWTIARSDGVLIGSALALVLAQRPERVLRALSHPDVPVVAGVVLGGATLLVRWDSPIVYRGGLFAFNVATAIFIGHLVASPGSVFHRVLTLGPLPAIGRMSYELYLFHVPMLYLVAGNPATRIGLWPFAAALVCSFGAAAATYELVDLPLLRFRRRFTPSRPALPVAYASP